MTILRTVALSARPAKAPPIAADQTTDSHWQTNTPINSTLEDEHENGCRPHESGQEVLHRDRAPNVAQSHVSERADDQNADSSPEIPSIKRYDEHSHQGNGPRPPFQIRLNATAIAMLGENGTQEDEQGALLE